MKKLLVALAAVLVSVSVSAQGLVTFNNRTPTGDARVTRPDGTGAGAGITAALYLNTGGTLTMLSPTTTFRTSAAAAFFVNAVNDLVVPGVGPGANATLRMRAWEGASYEAAAAGNTLLRGESNDITLALGGIPAGAPPIPTPGLSGLQGFQLVAIPEPSTIALGVLGAAALLLRRRK